MLSRAFFLVLLVAAAVTAEQSAFAKQGRDLQRADPDDCKLKKEQYYDPDLGICRDFPECKGNSNFFDVKKLKCKRCKASKGRAYSDNLKRCIRVCPKDPQIFYKPSKDKCACSGNNFKYKERGTQCVCKSGFEEIDGKCVQEVLESMRF